jgi:hypothetical protein
MIHTGDCIEVMAAMPADSVDAVVTDPPYGLEFMGKEWDRFGGEIVRADSESDTDPFSVQRGGSLPFGGGGKRVRYHNAPGQFQAWCEAWGREALRVTKPGGYLLAFGGTRTHHRLVCGLEDAGWIIRDELDWIYASGFPKGKANLKPAHEPIVLARKPGPLRPLAIDECRISTEGEAFSVPQSDPLKRRGMGGESVLSGKDTARNMAAQRDSIERTQTLGRWPSNVLLSSPELFDQPNPYVVGSGAVTKDGVAVYRNLPDEPAMQTDPTSWAIPKGRKDDVTFGDSGGYSRFFILPKADRRDREPTVRGETLYCECETDKPEWVSADPSRDGQTATTSRRRATSEATSMAASDSPMLWPGSEPTDQSPPVPASTMSTATSRTTDSPTSSSSMPPPTSGSTPAASSSTASGGSPVVSVASPGPSPTNGGISAPKDGPYTAAADPAISARSSKPSVCAECGLPKGGDASGRARFNAHPT